MTASQPTEMHVALEVELATCAGADTLDLRLLELQKCPLQVSASLTHGWLLTSRTPSWQVDYSLPENPLFGQDHDH